MTDDWWLILIIDYWLLIWADSTPICLALFLIINCSLTSLHLEQTYTVRLTWRPVSRRSICTPFPRHPLDQCSVRRWECTTVRKLTWGSPVESIVYMLKKRVIVSMLVIYYSSDVMKYDRWRLELTTAPLRMKKDTNRVEKYTLQLQFQSSTYLST